MRKLLIFNLFAALVIAPLLALGPPAFATGLDPVTGKGAAAVGDDFVSWSSSQVNNDGSPFWDNSSSDFTPTQLGNVGAWLTNQFQGGNGNEGPGALPFWGKTATGAAPGDYYFTAGPTPSGGATFEASFTSHNSTATGGSVDRFGWVPYDPLFNTLGTKVELFNTTQCTGTCVDVVRNFTPTGTYAYYMDLTNADGSSIFQSYYTVTSLDVIDRTNPPRQNHFALFKQGDPAYWIGVEDYIFNADPPYSDFDYNDLILEITPVPEPGTMLLGGTGLVLLGIALRRRFFGR